MLQNYQMTDFGEKLGQISVHLSLKLNVIKTNWFYAKHRGQQNQVVYKISIQWDLKMSKMGVNHAEVPYHIQVWECPPQLLLQLTFCLSNLIHI